MNYKTIWFFLCFFSNCCFADFYPNVSKKAERALFADYRTEGIIDIDKCRKLHSKSNTLLSLEEKDIDFITNILVVSYGDCLRMGLIDTQYDLALVNQVYSKIPDKVLNNQVWPVYVKWMSMFLTFSDSKYLNLLDELSRSINQAHYYVPLALIHEHGVNVPVSPNKSLVYWRLVQDNGLNNGGCKIEFLKTKYGLKLGKEDLERIKLSKDFFTNKRKTTCDETLRNPWKGKLY